VKKPFILLMDRNCTKRFRLIREGKYALDGGSAVRRKIWAHIKLNRVHRLIGKAS
jgi:hypothetical protein